MCLWFTRNYACYTCIMLLNYMFQVQSYVGQIFETEAIFKSHNLFWGNLYSIFQTAVFSVLSESKEKMAQKMGGPQHVSGCWVVYPHLQDFVLPLVEIHEDPFSPFLQLLKVPIKGRATLWFISHSSQFCVTSKPTEVTFCPIIQIINENTPHYWPQY